MTMRKIMKNIALLRLASDGKTLWFLALVPPLWSTPRVLIPSALEEAVFEKI
jgi:hypothetical protein